MKKDFKLMVAPLQGLTEVAWRSVHYRMFGSAQGDVEYFTPFIRVEKGMVRARDLRDFTSELNRGMNVTPQIIFRDVEEWKLLVDTLAESGATRIDMNMGCPFPPQVRKGRGAGLLARRDILAEIADAMEEYSGSIEFSVKMRLGIKDPCDALKLHDVLNSMPLRHVTVHPRTAIQQYKGELLPDEMDAFASKLNHPVIYNGEISTPADIKGLSSVYSGVMVGRGLLARPSIFAELRSGHEVTPAKQEADWQELLMGVASELEKRLCGEAQLRDKMKPYWEYAPVSMDRKAVKAGRKNGLIAF